MQALTLGNSVRDLYGARLTCLQPFPIYVPGEHKRPNPATGQVERTMVPCGRCKVCTRSRKATWTGRLVAEALRSEAVSFVTLTYADAPEGFEYSHVQTMLKRFRMALWRKHKTKVRFFCVGELGEKFGRVHWHLLFFFDRKYSIPRIEQGELWEHWEHGWTSAWDLPPEEYTRRARYCAKYAVKDFLNPCTVMRCSLKPGIGMQFLTDQAREMARQGLVPQGGFKVPGVTVSRGPDAGKLWDHKLAGTAAVRFIEAWEEEYFKCFPDADYPHSRFLRNFAENYIEPKAKARLDWRTLTQAPTIHVREADDRPRDCSGSFFIHVGREVAHLYLDGYGRAALDVDGVWYFVGMSIADALDLDPEDAAFVDGWLAERRGPDWSAGKAYGETATDDATDTGRRFLAHALNPPEVRAFARSSRGGAAAPARQAPATSPSGAFWRDGRSGVTGHALAAGAL